MKDEPTTENIIPVIANANGRPTVDARTLHAFLEVGKDFSNWIRGRIEKYGFAEGEDYDIGSPVLANQSGKGGDRRSRDYHLTLDMAKELAMVERNEKGKQARRYFIRCEEELRRRSELGWHLPRDLRRIVEARMSTPWAQKPSASILHSILPLGVFGEPSPNGRPRTRLRRACYVAARSRGKEAAALEAQDQFLELVWDDPSRGSTASGAS